MQQQGNSQPQVADNRRVSIEPQIKILRSQSDLKIVEDQINVEDVASIINKADYPSLLSKVLILINDNITKEDVAQVFKQARNIQDQNLDLIKDMKLTEFVEKYFKQSMRRDLFKLLQAKNPNIHNQSTIPEEAVIYIWSTAAKTVDLVENDKVKKALNQIASAH